MSFESRIDALFAAVPSTDITPAVHRLAVAASSPSIELGGSGNYPSTVVDDIAIINSFADLQLPVEVQDNLDRYNQLTRAVPSLWALRGLVAEAFAVLGGGSLRVETPRIPELVDDLRLQARGVSSRVVTDGFAGGFLGGAPPLPFTPSVNAGVFPASSVVVPAPESSVDVRRVPPIEGAPDHPLDVASPGDVVALDWVDGCLRLRYCDNLVKHHWHNGGGVYERTRYMSNVLGQSVLMPFSVLPSFRAALGNFLEEFTGCDFIPASHGALLQGWSWAFWPAAPHWFQSFGWERRIFAAPGWCRGYKEYPVLSPSGFRSLLLRHYDSCAVNETMLIYSHGACPGYMPYGYASFDSGQDGSWFSSDDYFPDDELVLTRLQNYQPFGVRQVGIESVNYEYSLHNVVKGLTIMMTPTFSEILLAPAQVVDVPRNRSLALRVIGLE